MNFLELFTAAATADSASPMAALAIIVATAIAIGAVTMQFLTLLRHEGEDAVVSSFTWLLLAAFAVAMGAFFWRQYGDYFLVLLMAVLASGATASLVLSLSKNDVIERVRETRGSRAASPDRRAEIDHVGDALRAKLDAARQARRAAGH